MKTLLIIPFLFFNVSHARCIKNVVKQWNNLKHHGKIIEIKNNERIFRKHSYTMKLRNKLGVDNHFQGVQRISGKNNFVVSGGDIRAKRADLFVIIDGKFQRKILIDMWPYWHPGGIQEDQNIVAISAEEWKKTKIAKIYFYDFKDPENPKQLKPIIDIPHTKSGAVLFQRLSDKRYLVGSHDFATIDLYFSKTADINDGFPEKPNLQIRKEDFVEGIRTDAFSTQSINLIQQCDDKLFITFFNNRGKLTPVINKKDLGQLFSLDLKGESPKLKFISEKHFTCKSKCNFAGATGISISKSGKLSVLSTHHFRKPVRKKFYVVEFLQN